METVKQKMPTPQQRPDLYDDFDYVDRPAGQKTGVGIPDRIQQKMDARGADKAKPAPAEKGTDRG